MNTSKTLHRLFHIPCAILVNTISFIARIMIALYDFWFMNKDSVNFISRRIVREVKFITPRIIRAIVLFAMCFPFFTAFMIFMIKLS